MKDYAVLFTYNGDPVLVFVMAENARDAVQQIKQNYCVDNIVACCQRVPEWKWK